VRTLQWYGTGLLAGALGLACSGCELASLPGQARGLAASLACYRSFNGI